MNECLYCRTCGQLEQIDIPIYLALVLDRWVLLCERCL